LGRRPFLFPVKIYTGLEWPGVLLARRRRADPPVFPFRGASSVEAVSLLVCDKQLPRPPLFVAASHGPSFLLVSRAGPEISGSVVPKAVIQFARLRNFPFLFPFPSPVAPRLAPESLATATPSNGPIVHEGRPDFLLPSGSGTPRSLSKVGSSLRGIIRSEQ